MRRISILLLLTALLVEAQTALAQETKKNEDKVYMKGKVVDSFTKAAIPDALVTLMRQDSTVVDTVRAYQTHNYDYNIGRTAGSTVYYINVKREPAHYILRFEHDNYETTFADYDMKRVGKRVEQVDVPTVYMKKTARAAYHEGGELDEVVVKATKVKMVYRGDTIVYNADAFNVPEGSMLDGLIKQLPGVELKEGGEIYVNGKKVENLTLNGADFFKGKNQIMLQNLPYFTVKNVEVYRKQTAENKLFGIDDEDKKELTMDVILKREYNTGGSANLEAGYGTDDRYKLKGFGLHYSDRTRAVMFGGLNNINETMAYEAYNSEYRDRSQQSGNSHFRQVGGQFVYLGPEDKVNNSTEVTAQWSDELTENRSQGETYMNDASTFSQSAGTNRSKPSSFRLRNTLRVSGSKLRGSGGASLRYDRSRWENEGWNVTTADALMHDSINSSWYRSRSESDWLQGNAYCNIDKQLPTGDNFTIYTSGDFSHSYHPLAQSLNHYAYHRLGTTDHRDRQTQSPAYSYYYSATLLYRYNMTKHLSFTPSVGLSNSVNSSDRHEYLRDSLDYMFDQQNSYEQKTNSLVRGAGLNINFNKSDEKHYMGLNANLNFNFTRQRMNYDSEPLTTEITRHYTQFSPTIYFYYMKPHSSDFTLQYFMYNQTPSVTDLIDRPITTDPLNIYLGNPDLKTSQEHSIRADYSLRRDSIDQVINFHFDVNMTHNQRTQGYTYDMTTGTRTYRPENISGGNWRTNFTTSWNRALGKQKFFHIGNELTLGYNRSTALAQTTTSTSAELSRVNSLNVGYKPSLRYQRGKLSLNLKGEVNYRNIHRNITIGTQPTDIWDFSYGLSGSYQLPWHFTIDTDFSVRSRRGYADAEMNDNRLYWDAALSKSLQQGRWVLKLRGYDLLGQVSSLNYYVSAQGRTETWTNCMRRYAMLTVGYRFTRKPKKKE